MISALLDQLVDVYVENSSTGKFDALVNAGLQCRVVYTRRLAHNEDERSELAGLRTLIFDGSYVMPETCQVDVDGVRWQPRPGTFMTYRDWTGATAYKSCQIERQQVAAL